MQTFTMATEQETLAAMRAKLDAQAPDSEPLTPAEVAKLEAALAETGPFLSSDELLRELGVTRDGRKIRSA
jgi:hypothetical protein